MKNQWRVLLRRAQQRTGIYASNHFSQSQFQVHLNSNLQSLRSITSPLHPHSLQNQVPLPSSDLLNFLNPISTTTRSFSSQTALERIESRHVAFLAKIFSGFWRFDEIEKRLELRNIVVNEDMLLKVLRKLYLDSSRHDDNAKVAWQFFIWATANDRVRLSSKSYNMMLYILGTNCYVSEFWDLVDTMKERGYGVSKGVCDKVLECLDPRTESEDIEKMKALFASGSIDNSAKMCSRVTKIVRNDVWSDEVEKNILDSNIVFSSDLVTLILDNLGTDPNKALIFFRWLEESGQFKHDGCTYNAMARVLGREDTIDRFWKIVHEMRKREHEMQPETYVKFLGKFCKRKMIKDAVDLYEIVMAGANKPSPQCCTFLLKNIVVSKQFDVSLFSRVVKAFTGSGNALASSTVDSVLKFLTSDGRSGECNKVLKALEDAGVLAAGKIQSKIAFRLSASGNKEEASEFISNIEASGSNLDHKAWESLIEGHCVGGNLDEALYSFQKMVDKEGLASANRSFNLLMNAYCRKFRAIDACKILCQLVREQQLEPRHSSYKSLIRKLLVQGGFTEAVNILGLMRSHGFPPYIDPFIEHVSKYGTEDDAILFLREMTSEQFPSTSVLLRMFDAFSKHGKQEAAHNLLSKCPDYIRNNAEVLNFFCSMKSKEGETSGTLGA